VCSSDLGIGSDHVDLQAAMDHKVDVVELEFRAKELLPEASIPTPFP
jgi:lactate dehydrogenase-like 2-hydroxyacid dehydrogenase